MSIAATVKGILGSASAPAIASFLLVNGLFAVMAGVTGGELYDAMLLQNRDVFNRIRAGARGVDVLFLGSSVIELPLSLLDGEYRYVPEPKRAQEMLSHLCGRPLVVKNYCIEAALVSDQYITVRRLIREAKAPQLVVLAVAPRDFSDARFPSPGKTDTFKSLVTISDCRILPLFIRSFDDYAQFFWNRLIPLYRYRALISSAIGFKLQALLLPAPPAKVSEQVQVWDTGRNLPQRRKSDSAADGALGGSADRRAARFARSTAEYTEAYSLFGRTTLHETEYQFLRRFCRECRSNRLPVVVMVMPLTDLNKQLLPAGVYHSYIKEVESCCRDEQIPCLNLDAGGRFEDGDFHDGAHLGADGARKVLNVLAPHIKGLLH